MIAPHPFMTYRGSPLNVFNKLKVLDDMGYAITLLTYPEGENIDLPNVTIKRVPLIPLLKNIPVGVSIHKIAYDALLLLYGIYLTSREEYKVIHAHEIDGAFIGAILKLIKRKNVILFYDMHSLIFELIDTDSLIGNALNWLSKIIEKFLYGISDKLLIISPAFSERISKFGQSEKIVFLPDTAPIEEVIIDKYLTNELNSKFGDKKILLYTGNLEKYQGIDLLIEAFKKVEKIRKDAVLLIVGGREDQVKKYKNKIENMGLKNVYFIKQKPMEKIPTYLEFSYAVLSPRLSGSNIPFKIYPYLKHGKAIIATNIPSHNLILKDGENALLCNVSSADLAQKILNLLEDVKLKKKLELGAKKLYEENFNKEIYIKKLRSVYEYDL